jgi:hypothetical protein
MGHTVHVYRRLAYCLVYIGAYWNRTLHLQTWTSRLDCQDNRLEIP